MEENIQAKAKFILLVFQPIGMLFLAHNKKSNVMI